MRRILNAVCLLSGAFAVAVIVTPHAALAQVGSQLSAVPPQILLSLLNTWTATQAIQPQSGTRAVIATQPASDFTTSIQTQLTAGSAGTDWQAIRINGQDNIANVSCLEWAFSSISTATGPAICGLRTSTTAADTIGYGTNGDARFEAWHIIGASQRINFSVPESFTGTIPVVTGTGTPTITTGSTDTAGEVTSGTTATSVVITFSTVKTNAPFCVVTAQTQLVAFAYTISTSAITITQTATTGEKIDYRCAQR